MSKVTIITPIYNNKEDILDAINSVINQSYNNWEHIIIDDYSTDGLFVFLKEYISKHKLKRIKLFRNSKNRGTYFSINKAIKISDGKYITLLGSDDTFHIDKLSKQVALLDSYPNVMVTEAWYKRSDRLVKHNCATLMFRRLVINDIGYFDSVRFGADSEFKHRLMKYYKSRAFKTIPEVLYFAKIRKNSLTRSKVTGRRDVRLDYRDKFYKWHKNSKDLFMSFPLKKRPFQVNPIML